MPKMRASGRLAKMAALNAALRKIHIDIDEETLEVRAV
jgi:hypothetical protein